MITLWITVRCCGIRKNKYINSSVVNNVKRCSKHDNFSLLALPLSKGHDNENHIDGNLANTSPYYHQLIQTHSRIERAINRKSGTENGNKTNNNVENGNNINMNDL